MLIDTTSTHVIGVPLWLLSHHSERRNKNDKSNCCEYFYTIQDIPIYSLSVEYQT